MTHGEVVRSFNADGSLRCSDCEKSAVRRTGSTVPS